MLWTDSIFVSVTDMERVDSEVSHVATAEGITLAGNTGLLRGAVEESSYELQKILISFGGYIGSGDVTANHMAAVMNVGLGNSVRQKALLSQVVVSGEVEDSWNWIKQWAVFWALQVFYRDAFNRTVKDRYEGKMRYYKSELQRRVTPTIFGLGLPLVQEPLACPGAIFERDSGSWGSDNVSLVTGAGTLNSVNRDVVITYADMSASNRYVSPIIRNNAESHPSEVITVAMITGNVLNIDINSLNPPTGAQNPSQILICVIKPMAATHWNVYVGTSGGELYLQNTSPIPIATKVFTLPANPLTSGPTAGLGQYATRRMSLAPTRQRG